MARAGADAPVKKRRGRKAPPPPRKPPWWRRHRRAVAAGLALLMLGFGVRLFVLPATDVVDSADAVVIMPGSGDGGLTTALALVNGQRAGVLVVLGGAERSVPAAARLCTGDAPVEVLCPNTPDDSRGQAAALGTLITERAWQRIAVVSARARSSRDALLVARCTDATVLRQLATGDGAAGAAVGAVRELPRYLQALFFRQGCTAASPPT
ncbi:MAG: hypothetical protein IT196_23460 [Acidimicrobiales bacterium]|nr:hypothetical protein [Acidimicrobiales bacterium]